MQHLNIIVTKSLKCICVIQGHTASYRSEVSSSLQVWRMCPAVWCWRPSAVPAASVLVGTDTRCASRPSSWCESCLWTRRGFGGWTLVCPGRPAGTAGTEPGPASAAYCAEPSDELTQKPGQREHAAHEMLLRSNSDCVEAKRLRVVFEDQLSGDHWSSSHVSLRADLWWQTDTEDDVERWMCHEDKAGDTVWTQRTLNAPRCSTLFLFWWVFLTLVLQIALLPHSSWTDVFQLGGWRGRGSSDWLRSRLRLSGAEWTEGGSDVWLKE